MEDGYLDAFWEDRISGVSGMETYDPREYDEDDKYDRDFEEQDEWPDEGEWDDLDY